MNKFRYIEQTYLSKSALGSHVIQQDINDIPLDLREAHRDDFFSVPEQASLAFICKRLRLNFKKLSVEERKWLKKISEKSDLRKNPNP